MPNDVGARRLPAAVDHVKSRDELAARQSVLELFREFHPETAARLLTAAVDAFSDVGYHATTTRVICGGAELSSAALYVYFSSKEDMLREVVLAGHLRLNRALIEAREAAVGGTSIEQLDAFVRADVLHHAQYRRVSRVAQNDFRSLSTAGYEEIVRLRRETSDMLQDILTRGEAEGLFRIIDLRTVSRAILSLDIDVSRWFRGDREQSAEEVARYHQFFARRLVQFKEDDAVSPSGSERLV